tara:strand:- start:252 stop:446 length:195 start_codon:yes stop_codon:yes gene_type:complete
MTLTKLQKDIQTYSFNEGMITLIDNILSTNYKDLEELKMMLGAWKLKTITEQNKMDTKYEGLKQ